MRRSGSSTEVPFVLTHETDGVRIKIEAITFSAAEYRIKPNPSRPGVPRWGSVTRVGAHARPLLVEYAIATRRVAPAAIAITAISAAIPSARPMRLLTGRVAIRALRLPGLATALGLAMATALSMIPGVPEPRGRNGPNGFHYLKT